MVWEGGAVWNQFKPHLKTKVWRYKAYNVTAGMIKQHADVGCHRELIMLQYVWSERGMRFASPKYVTNCGQEACTCVYLRNRRHLPLTKFKSVYRWQQTVSRARDRNLFVQRRSQSIPMKGCSVFFVLDGWTHALPLPSPLCWHIPHLPMAMPEVTA